MPDTEWSMHFPLETVIHGVGVYTQYSIQVLYYNTAYCISQYKSNVNILFFCFHKNMCTCQIMDPNCGFRKHGPCNYNSDLS